MLVLVRVSNARAQLRDHKKVMYFCFALLTYQCLVLYYE